MTPLSIAMIGLRGVPATFGGIEHHVEQVGERLAARGHRVTVYCRTNYARPTLAEHRGMDLCYLPTIGTKHLDALVHTGMSTVDAMARRFDIVHLHAIGPGVFGVVPRVLGGPAVVQTVHGLDGERGKWGPLPRLFLSAATHMSATLPDATIVVARDLVDHYQSTYGRTPTWIPNGAPRPCDGARSTALRDLGLVPRGYVLFVGRLVPEKAIDLLLRAFGDLPGDIRLVVVGGSSFSDDYVAMVQALAESDPRVVLPGYVYGADLAELYRNAAVFVLPSRLEGLPLTLLEAAAHGAPVIASDIDPHREILRTDGPGHRLVPVGDERALTRALRAALADNRAEVVGARGLQADVMERYDWDAVAVATEQAYEQALDHRDARRRARRAKPVLAGRVGGGPS